MSAEVGGGEGDLEGGDGVDDALRPFSSLRGPKVILGVDCRGRGRLQRETGGNDGKLERGTEGMKVEENMVVCSVAEAGDGAMWHSSVGSTVRGLKRSERRECHESTSCC